MYIFVFKVDEFKAQLKPRSADNLVSGLLAQQLTNRVTSKPSQKILEIIGFVAFTSSRFYFFHFLLISWLCSCVMNLFVVQFYSLYTLMSTLTDLLPLCSTMPQTAWFSFAKIQPLEKLAKCHYRLIKKQTLKLYEIFSLSLKTNKQTSKPNKQTRKTIRC